MTKINIYKYKYLEKKMASELINYKLRRTTRKHEKKIINKIV